MRRTIQALLLLALVCCVCDLDAQVKGCRDAAANNYNTAATNTDGSCTYDMTPYTPPVKVKPLAASLSETSGLQWAAGSLWTFNDAGGQASLYRIDTLTNLVLQTVTLEGASNVDWEDIGFDGTHFYIGDFGNYVGDRKDLKIYKFPLAAIPEPALRSEVTIPVTNIEIIHYHYVDQPQPITPTAPNNTAFDCEAMIIDQGSIHLFTKDWVNKTTTHYRINSTRAGSYSAQPIETLPANYLITGADITPDKAVVVLVGYNNTGLAPHYMHILSDFNGGLFFNGNKRRIDLPDVTRMGQAEGITLRSTTYGYISSERFAYDIGNVTFTVDPMLLAFDLTPFVPLYLMPVKLKNFIVNEQLDTHQISWEFDKTVPLLKVQHSTDGTSFVDLSSFAKTINGSTTHSPAADINFYRLHWLTDAGLSDYSQIIKMQKGGLPDISHFVLKANGELRFTINSNATLTYGFRLTGLDGRLIGQEEPKLYSSGRHTISYQNVQGSGTILLLTIFTAGSTKTVPLQVQ